MHTKIMKKTNKTEYIVENSASKISSSKTPQKWRILKM